MRKVGRRRRKKINKIIVLSAFCLLFVITAGYAAFSTNINLHVKGNILEGTRVIQEWDSNSQTDFHSDFYKQNIVSITFLNNNNIPENAVDSWNVSEDKEKGTVKAWVVPNSSDLSKYDLYIGAKGKVIANENSGYLFYGFKEVNLINFNGNFDTSKSIDMKYMFYDCSNLINLDLSSFKTDNTTDMRAMFYKCNKLTNLNITTFNTSKVTQMAYMFNDCNSLTTLDLSNFNTSQVTSMAAMFYNCESLTTLNVSSFDTRNVTTMQAMFASLKLNTIDVSNFNTDKVTNMRSMFANCQNLEELDLSNFNTQDVTDMAYMFVDDIQLTVIYVGKNWTIDKADTTLIFNNCGTDHVTLKQ